MRVRTNRLTATIVITILDVAAGKYYYGAIWQVFAGNPFAKAALLGLLCLWTASMAVLWLHVAYDLCQILRDRDGRLALHSAVARTEPERDSDV